MTTGIEFLRFGSSIPGAYWGCCAADIIQCFSTDPNEKASIQLVSGDGASPFLKDGKSSFLGKTNKEVFLQRLRIGTFSTLDMPNHAFFAIITQNQLNTKFGKEWLAILKENGFEFIRTVCNSVYSGQKPLTKEQLEKGFTVHDGSSKNYVFALFRNIGNGSIGAPHKPPVEWTLLPSVVPEYHDGVTDEQFLELANKQRDAQMSLWDNLPEVVKYTADELREDNIPVVMAGRRSAFPQQLESEREYAEKQQAEGKKVTHPDDDPFDCGLEDEEEIAEEDFATL